MRKQIIGVLRSLCGLLLTVGCLMAAYADRDPGVLAIVAALILIANSIDSKGE